MLTLLTILIALDCILLIGVILIQNPKGGGVDSVSYTHLDVYKRQLHIQKILLLKYFLRLQNTTTFVSTFIFPVNQEIAAS